MSANLPLEWEDKENNAELLAFLQQYGSKEYLTAEEINQLRDGINELFYKISKTSYTEFKFIQKGFGNIDLSQNQIGDIFCGWSNDGTRRISEAKWLGGALNNSDNFIPLIQTEI